MPCARRDCSAATLADGRLRIKTKSPPLLHTENKLASMRHVELPITSRMPTLASTYATHSPVFRHCSPSSLPSVPGCWLFEVRPPLSLSLATRCRQTRDLRGAQPPKTITKCQGCHCAHVRRLRARVLRSHIQSCLVPRFLPASLLPPV